MSEHDQTKAVVSWFKRQYPKYAECLVGSANGSHISGNVYQRKNKMDKLKAEGLKPGASDFFIAVPRGGKHGLWVEMKDVKLTWCSVKKNQRKHIDLMHEMGYEAIWCAGADIAIAAIKTYMGQDDV